jgi:CopG family transcriptional regulator, nickel-responsive regulator
MVNNDSQQLIRFSVSIPRDVAEGLDQMAAERGFANRSQCVTSLVREQLVRHAEQNDDAVMMGILSLIYDHQKRDLQNKLTDIQHRYLKEIITVQLVHLEQQRSLQVILLQGPARTLRQIADQMITLKGVRHGQLQLNVEILPPLHEA